LRTLGITIGRNTIKRILQEHGIEPAPQRGKGMPWKTFIKSHLGEIVAAVFFTVEVLTTVGLVRYHVLIVIDIGSRRVEIASIVHNPGGEWMKQVSRNLTDVFGGFLRGKRYIILDRDPLFTAAFRDMLKSSGVKPVRLPARSPDLNAFAERFVLSIRTECLSKIVPLGERHLRSAIESFVAHYHLERPHQGIGNELITASPTPVNSNAPIECRERLGGISKHYYRRAAW